MYVAFFVEVGLLLLVLPWSGFWEQNYFAGLFPWLKGILTNNYIRGAISGLGVVNLYAGFAELMLVFIARDRLRQGYGESADASAKAERHDRSFSDTTGHIR